MTRLLELGFQKVGECQRDTNLKSGVRFIVNNLRNDRVIYAYEVEGRVKYIGVCHNTNTKLKDRMSRYQAMQGAGTNEKITKLIRECLEKGQQVNIMAWKPDNKLKLKGITVDLVKGLENPLIGELNPEWNTQR